MPKRQIRDASSAGFCDTHEKLHYDSRSRARNAIRALSGDRMRAYACDAVPGMFHIGHLPEVVRNGHLTAGEIYTDPDPETQMSPQRARGRATRPAGPPDTAVCHCKNGPVTVFTFRNEQLVTVERRHWQSHQCQLPAQQLDPNQWKPRP